MGEADVALVSFDTDRIKDYVFRYGRLQDIRGASSKLDRLNREEMPKIASDLPSRPQPVYSNGGGALFLAEPDDVQELITKVQELYIQETVTGSITGVALPAEKKRLGQDFSEYWVQLSSLMREAKRQKDYRASLSTFPFARKCQACGSYPAAYLFQGAKAEDGEQYLCSSCYHKRKEGIGGRSPLRRRYEDFRRRQGIPSKVDWPDDLDDIGEANRGGLGGEFIGVIYCDGNDMGEALARLKSLDEMKRFSEAVDYATNQAAFRAVYQRLEADHPSHKPLPFEPIILGGDDVIVVTSASSALEVAMDIINFFAQEVQGTVAKSISLSAGVAIAPAKYPLSNVVELAEELLKSAKKGRVIRRRHPEWSGYLNANPNRSDPGSPGSGLGQSNSKGMIDFAVLAGGVYPSLGPMRENWVRLESERWLNLSLRPYAVEELAHLVGCARALKGAGMPKNKLQRLRRSLLESKADFALTCLEVVSRLRPHARQEMQRIFHSFGSSSLNPWVDMPGEESIGTPMLDLMEVYDLVG